MQDVKDWLDSEERDYSTGLILLSKYSRNRILVQNLARKSNTDKLIYELEKICSREKVITNIQTVVTTFPTPLHVHAIETLIKSKPIIKCSDLPDYLQVVWTENKEKYKMARALHEKCKLLKTQEERTVVLEDMESLRKDIFANWEYLDKYIENKNKGLENEEKGPVIDEKGINAARTFLSKGLAYIKDLHGAAKAKKIDAMQKRVDELLEVKAPITDEYKQSLEKIGISFNG